MDLLKPEWDQPRPTLEAALAIQREVKLLSIPFRSESIDCVIDNLRESHANGGAHLACTLIESNRDFDWFASRNRLLEFDILPNILRREEVRQSIPELLIPVIGESAHQ